MTSERFGKRAPRTLSVKLHKKGQKFVGIILTEPTKKQQTLYGGSPGELAFWPSGDPKMVWVFQMLKISEVVCDCEEWCNEGAKNTEYGGENDDGLRFFRVPASGNLITAMTEALKDAGSIDKAGEPELEVGGTFAVQRTGLDYERAKKTGGKPPVTFGAAYKLPTEASLARVKEYLAEKEEQPQQADPGLMQDLEKLLNDEPEPMTVISSTPQGNSGEKMDFDRLIQVTEEESANKA